MKRITIFQTDRQACSFTLPHIKRDTKHAKINIINQHTDTKNKIRKESQFSIY